MKYKKSDFVDTAIITKKLLNDECEFDKKIINHPQRYGGDTTYECIKVLKAWMNEDEYKGFLRGNCLKYLCRVGKKDENVQEINKAKWYLEKLIEVESEKNKKNKE